MKRSIFFSVIVSIFLSSCVNHEVIRSHLLEYRNNGAYSSSKGYAVKYSAYKNEIKKSNIWNIYETGTDAIVIWVPDTTFAKNTYTYPAFSVEYITGDSRTYHDTEGQFRLLGIDVGDLIGDFHFKLKNIANANDSLMITEGYFRIFLQYQDTLLTK